jgi:hypothetical protein
MLFKFRSCNCFVSSHKKTCKGWNNAKHKSVSYCELSIQKSKHLFHIIMMDAEERCPKIVQMKVCICTEMIDVKVNFRYHIRDVPRLLACIVPLHLLSHCITRGQDDFDHPLFSNEWICYARADLVPVAQICAHPGLLVHIDDTHQISRLDLVVDMCK